MKKVAMVAILVCSISAGVFSDIPRSVANKPYTPSFSDWVYVLFQTYETQTDDYFVGVYREMINFRVRFTFRFYYAPNEIGREYYEQVWPMIKDNVKLDCETWTSEGYPISLNDIVFIESIYPGL